MSTRIRNRKNYHQWILDHQDEILALPNKERTDYVMSKLNDELGVEMKRYNVYQLLYRNGLIKHKNKSEPEIEIATETTTDTTILSRNSLDGRLPMDSMPVMWMGCM